MKINITTGTAIITVLTWLSEMREFPGLLGLPELPESVVFVGAMKLTPFVIVFEVVFVLPTGVSLDFNKTIITD